MSFYFFSFVGDGEFFCNLKGEEFNMDNETFYNSICKLKDIYSITNDLFQEPDDIILRSFVPYIAKHAIPSMEISAFKLKDDIFEIGESKMGGNPDVPKTFIWPTSNNIPLSFIMQINCSETNFQNVCPIFPTTGIISFFLATKTSNYSLDANQNWCKVFYFKECDVLSRKVYPGDFSEARILQSKSLEFRKKISVPSDLSGIIDQLKMTPEQIEHYEMDLRIYTDLLAVQRHRIFGHPYLIQKNSWIDKVTSTIGEDYQSGKNLPINFDSNGFTLLLQFDSECSDEINLLDAGVLTVWIKNEHLVQKKFDEIKVFLQSC